MYLEDIRGETQRIIGIKGGDYLLTAFVGTNSLRGSKGIYTAVSYTHLDIRKCKNNLKNVKILKFTVLK